MSIRIQQDSSPHKRDWWTWSVWLDGPDRELDQVAYVEYVLHPTFTQPIQHIEDRDSRFRLNANGWGEFMIHVNIHRRDGGVDKLEHWLRLEGAPTRGGVGATTGLERRPPEMVYVSYSVADAALMDPVVEALAKRGVRALTSDDFDPDLPLDEAMRRLSESVECGIVALSDMRNPSLSKDMSALQRNQTPILVVLIGPDAHLPRELSSYPVLHLKDRGDSEGAAQAIWERLQTMTVQQ